MEGKCVLFKTFGGVDAISLCILSKDIDENAHTISLLLGSFGGINLEDIAAPRCFEIERKLKEISDIPIAVQQLSFLQHLQMLSELFTKTSRILPLLHQVLELQVLQLLNYLSLVAYIQLKLS